MKRIPDLSVRPPTNGGRNPNINFRDQKRYVNTVTSAAAKVLDIFDPKAAVTVQWIIVQVSTAVTLQAYLNGQPFGAALALGAGAVLHYPGTLLAPNEKLQFSVSGATTINFEVVYVNAIRPDLIDTDLMAVIVGGTQAISGAVTISGQPVAVSGFPGQYPIADTLGNQLLGDGAGDLRINPFGPTGSAKLQTATGVAGGAAISLQVPAGKKWKVLGGVIKLVTNATVATRAANLNFSDSGQVLFIASGYGTATQAASLTRFYPWGPGLAQYSAFIQDVCQFTMPVAVLPPLSRVNVNIISGNAGDAVTLWANVLEYND